MPCWPRAVSYTHLYPKGFRYAQQKAITFEVGMQDSALGATLALTSFATNPLAAVPSTFFSVWHNISGSILSSWWRNHDDKHEIHWDSDNGEDVYKRQVFWVGLWVIRRAESRILPRDVYKRQDLVRLVRLLRLARLARLERLFQPTQAA